MFHHRTYGQFRAEQGSLQVTYLVIAMDKGVLLAEMSKSGNGGHCKLIPRWEMLEAPEHGGRLPELVKDAILAVFDYYYKPDNIPSLSTLSEHTRQDGGIRINRSEAREVDALIIASILFHTDLTTLRIATPLKDGKFINRSQKELAACVGMIDPKTGKASKKFTRGFTRLVRAGLVTSHAVSKKNEKGEIRRRNSAKAVSEDLYVLLLGGTLKAQERVRKARQGHSRATWQRRGRSKGDGREDIVGQTLARRNAIRAKEQEAKQAKQESAASVDAADMLTADCRKVAYNKAKQSYQRELLESGLGFNDIHAKLRAFPSIENWNG